MRLIKIMAWAVAMLLPLREGSRGLGAPPLPPEARTLVVDFGQSIGMSVPRVGFLGGLWDDTPDALIDPLHPTLWRIGHQFRKHIAGGLPAAIARVEKLGATYKLVMSDLIDSKPRDYATYEAAVKKLVASTGERAPAVIWEVANEPDEGYKPIDKYYELYAHAFKALREANPSLSICGPSFAFPSYKKYQAFLDYCRANHLECNDLSWHFTSWDASAPERQKLELGKMREFLSAYPEQKIREIHCDEWGAGPDKPTPANPGRLQPGRAIIWFYYLEDVFQVDRACRADWGKADDYLGGLTTPQNEPYPAYHAYRFYGSTAGLERSPVTGNSPTLAALAYRSAAAPEAAAPIRQILFGSIAKPPSPVTLELRNLGIDPAKVEIDLLPNTNLDAPMTEAQVPRSSDYTLDRRDGVVFLTLNKVEENQAYRVRLMKQ